MRSSAGPQAPGASPAATPALVNLVCTGGRLNSAAYAATILDLAGRGYLSASEPRPGALFVQVPGFPPPTDELTSYEQRALARSAQLAGQSGAPFEVLAGASGADVSGTWQPFAADVMAAAKATGLIRRVMPAWAPRALTFGLIGVPAVVLAATHPHPASRSVGALAAVVLALAIVAPLLIGRRERLSGSGKALAAAYRDGGATRPGRLAGPGAVGPAPPGDLGKQAYDLAVGRRLPIQGATPAETSGMRTRGRKLFPGRSERPQQAWSSFSGQWRLVPIGHDQRVPQLRRTWPVGFFAVMTGVSAVFISLQPLASATRAEVAGGLLVICVASALWFARELRQWSHYRAEKEIAGQVIARWEETRVGDPKNFKVSYVAVDDGRQAWPVSAVIGLGGIQPGDQVRLRVAGPSVTIISRTPVAGPAPEDAGLEDGP
jgi:hypothetical protein